MVISQGQRWSNKSTNKEQLRSKRYRQRRSLLGGYRTPIENRARSRHQANSSGDSGWVATAMHMQGQAINYSLDEPPDPGEQLRQLRQGGRLLPVPQTNFSGVCRRAETEHCSKE